MWHPSKYATSTMSLKSSLFPHSPKINGVDAPIHDPHISIKFRSSHLHQCSGQKSPSQSHPIPLICIVGQEELVCRSNPSASSPDALGRCPEMTKRNLAQRVVQRRPDPLDPTISHVSETRRESSRFNGAFIGILCWKKKRIF